MWPLIVPIVGIVGVVAIPLVRHVEKTRAEAAAIEFLRRVQRAQAEFRAGRSDGGYASDLASLMTPCPTGESRTINEDDIALIDAVGYKAQLRAAEGSATSGVDCHGRATVADYYSSAAPQSATTAGQQAFATTATGRIYVFFDGIPPIEKDMRPTGLATPVEALGTFKIP